MSRADAFLAACWKSRSESLVTEGYSVNCEVCGVSMGYFLYDAFGVNAKKRTCLPCHNDPFGTRTESERRGFPKGKSFYGPCKKCKPPEVRWYEVANFGDIDNGCTEHNVHEPRQIDKLLRDGEQEEDLELSLFD